MGRLIKVEFRRPTRYTYGMATNGKDSPAMTDEKLTHPHATDPQWFDRPGCLADLWRWMQDEYGEVPNDPAYFMEKPYKWTEEWEKFMADYDRYMNS